MESSSVAQPEASSHRLRWGAAAWIGILLAIGAVQAVRAQWFDAAVFFAIAAVLLIEALGRRKGERRTGERPTGERWRAVPQTRWVRVAAVGAGAVACIVPRHSLLMQLIVCAVGASAILIAWPGTERAQGPWTPGMRRLAWSWAVIVVAGCLWELAQFIIGLRHPASAAFALSDLLDPLVSTWPGRAVFIALWLSGGVFLASRGRR